MVGDLVVKKTDPFCANIFMIGLGNLEVTF